VVNSANIYTRTQQGVICDEVKQSPVDEYQSRFRRRVVISLLGIALLLLAVWLVRHFTADRPTDYSDIRDQFKYGSIGSEPGGTIFDPIGGVLPPYWIFKVMPDVCRDKLPGGYASLGLIYESGKDLPIGVSRRRRLGVDQLGFNCALCHTGRFRDSPSSEDQVVMGMPAHQLDLQAFFRFELDCSLDERFTADTLLGRMRMAGAKLSLLDRLLYRESIIGLVRENSLRMQDRLGILLGPRVTSWGRGRVDTFNPYKGLQFNWRLDQLPPDELVGAADFPSIWNQRVREGMHLHWDGNNDSVDERNLSAALGAGVTPVTIDHERLKRIRDWIWTLAPPKYPYEVDEVQAARGRVLYDTHCAACHQFGGAKIGTVTAIGEIATDPHRLNSYTYMLAANQGALYPDSGYRFSHFRKTNGYANVPLDGIWARAPYLHNGSVPTLRDLLEKPASRPKSFIRGYDVFDRVKVGFISSLPKESSARCCSEYDTTLPGDSNGGHLYGTDLPPEEKDALVQYMKTL